MNLNSVIQCLRGGHDMDRALTVIANFSHPLSEREHESFVHLAQRRQEELNEATSAKDIPPIQPELAAFLQRPLKLIPSSSAVMCIVGIAKYSWMPPRILRRALKMVLPQIVRLATNPPSSEGGHGHTTTPTPLGESEWNSILTSVSHTVSDAAVTRSMLRCAEELLKLSLPVVATSSQATLLEMWRGVLVRVLRCYAVEHNTNRKIGVQGPKDIATGHAAFLTSVAVSRLGRCFAQEQKKHQNNDSENVVTKLFVQSIQSLGTSSASAFVVNVFASTYLTNVPLAKSVLTSAIKQEPGVVSAFLGRRPAPGSIAAINSSESDDVLLHCLYNLSLTTTTLPMARDFYAVIQSWPVAELAKYLAEKQADVLTQLTNPFVNNPKVFCSSIGMMEEFSWATARLLNAANSVATVFPALQKLVTQLLPSRCRSGDEKAALLYTLLACKSISVEPLTITEAEIHALVKTELDSAAIESVRASWGLLKQFNQFSGPLQAPIQTAIKNSRQNKDDQRRVVVSCMPFNSADIAVVAKELLTECGEIDSYRGDAYLALPTLIANPQLAGAGVTLPNLVKSLCQAKVFQAFTSKADLEAATDVAITLAGSGYYDAVAVLLTHRSGMVRSKLRTYLESVKQSASSVISLWGAMTRAVFGLEQTEKPQILQDTATEALLVVAPLLLKHTAKLIVDSALEELLLCFAHDNAIGEDHTFFLPRHAVSGVYRTTSISFDRSAFDRTFRQHRHLLQLHGETLCTTLCARVVSPHAHVASAACRALSLLLSVASPAMVSNVFTSLGALVQKHVTYYKGLSKLDAAIATQSSKGLEAYERAVLTEKNLLKSYTPKPPKGMSEEDYEDMKRKDGIALAAGREVVRKEIAKRQLAVQVELRANLSALVALRFIGTNGGMRWEGLPSVYPILLGLLSDVDVREHHVALYNAALDAAIGLVSTSPLHLVSEAIIVLTSNLHHATFLTAESVSSIAAIAHHIRQSGATNMLPPPIFTVLLPFLAVSFLSGKNKAAKTIPVQTQHQLLSVLSSNIAHENLPCQDHALEVLFMILRNFPSLFKIVQNASQTLTARVGPSALQPLLNGLMLGTDVVKECTASAFTSYSHFAEHRAALVMALVVQQDDSVTVNQCMTKILKQYNFTPEPQDWEELLRLLELYGPQSDVAVARISKVYVAMLTQFPQTQEEVIPKIIAIGGAPAIRALERLAPQLTSACTQKTFEFLCNCAEKSAAHSEAVLSCGRKLLQVCSMETMNILAPVYQPRLKRPPTNATAEHKEQFLAMAVVWLTIMGCRMSDVPFLESVIDQQAAVLNTSNSADVHYYVCESMIQICSDKKNNLRESAKVVAFAETCLKTAIQSGSYVKKKAHAYGLAGVVQGLGVSSLRRFKVMDAIVAASKEKQAQRSGAMVLIEVLADVLGYGFEPYALTLIPLLLECVSEKDPKISECGDDAAKSMMRNLSDVGLRQLIPKLVAGLQSDQTKKRTPSLSFIGYVAFCSPRQLAATLPNIMHYICECLFDANNAVATAAYAALKRVAGVVSNPEIQEHVDVVLQAMRHPSSDTEGALDALLYTRFVNVIDAASLALIIPVILRGLGEMMHNTKAKSAQIVASVVQLVGDRKCLLPYMDELLVRLQNAAQDPLSEVRTTSAKAISALAAQVDERYADQVCEWGFNVLRRGTSSAEKAGASQVFVELVSACGEHVLATHFDTIELGMNDESMNVREGYMHIMVYAPSTLPTVVFQNFLPRAFPWVLRGLSDLNERVRAVSLLAGSSIIGLYGTRNLALVLKPLLDGVISEQTNLRQSSMLLASKLLIHLVNNIKKKLRIEIAEAEEAAAMESPEPTEEEEEDQSLAQGGEIVVETARDAEKRGVSILASLEEQLGHENFLRIMAAMHIGRCEHNLNVRTETTTAWQICVASPRTAMTKIFSGIITMLMKFASSENPECVDVAESCIEYTCARLNENVERFVDRFAEEFKGGQRRHRLGALICMTSVVQFADAQRLMRMGGQFVSCVLPAMNDEDPGVQAASGVLLERVTKVVGSRLIESVVESQLSTSVRGVLEVVKVRANVALAVIFKNLYPRAIVAAQLSEGGERIPPYTLHDLELLESIIGISDEIEEEVFSKYLEKMVDILLVMIRDELEGAEDALESLTEILPEHSQHLPLQAIQKYIKSPATKLAGIRGAGAYARGIQVDAIESIEAVFRIAISTLGDDDEPVLKAAVSILMELPASIDKRVIAHLDAEESADVTSCKRAAGRFALQFLDVFHQTFGVTARSYCSGDVLEFTPLLTQPKLLDVFVGFYGRVLEYGTAPERLTAIECLHDLLTFAPTAVRPIAGSIAGRCSKNFNRNEPAVTLAIAQLVQKLLSFENKQEKLVESSLAMGIMGALLCDMGAARVAVLRLVLHLLGRSPALADSMLNSVPGRVSLLDTPLLKAIACRFISIVSRNSTSDKYHERMMTIVKPMWEAPDSAIVGVAAGSAIGALCRSTKIDDETFNGIVSRALAQGAARGNGTVGAFACMYSLLRSASSRLPSDFSGKVLDLCKQASGFVATDRLCSKWILRCVALAAQTSKTTVSLDPYAAILKRVDVQDETMCSTVSYVVEATQGLLSAADATKLAETVQEKSPQWEIQNGFDADLDDEKTGDQIY